MPVLQGKLPYQVNGILVHCKMGMHGTVGVVQGHDHRVGPALIVISKTHMDVILSPCIRKSRYPSIGSKTDILVPIHGSGQLDGVLNGERALMHCCIGALEGEACSLADIVPTDQYSILEGNHYRACRPTPICVVDLYFPPSIDFRMMSYEEPLKRS